MSFIGNLFWIILGGLFVALEYLIGGILLCLTIIGIPFGIQTIKLGILALLPFGRDVKSRPNAPTFLSTIFNIIWILIGGIWICVSHLVLAILFAITLVGIPFAKQHLKLAKLSLTPFGYEIV